MSSRGLEERESKAPKQSHIVTSKGLQRQWHARSDDLGSVGAGERDGSWNGPHCLVTHMTDLTRLGSVDLASH
jgi:hypothetical protein